MKTLIIALILILMMGCATTSTRATGMILQGMGNGILKGSQNQNRMVNCYTLQTAPGIMTTQCD